MFLVNTKFFFLQIFKLLSLKLPTLARKSRGDTEVSDKPDLRVKRWLVPLEDSIAFCLRLPGQPVAFFEGGISRTDEHLLRHLEVAVSEESITVIPRIHLSRDLYNRRSQ